MMMRTAAYLIVAALGGMAISPALGDASEQSAVPALPAPPFAAFAPNCAVAAVSPEHSFVAVDVTEGDTLTNVQLIDPQGTTTIVRVAITPGLKPVTVLLQAESAVV